MDNSLEIQENNSSKPSAKAEKGKKKKLFVLDTSVILYNHAALLSFEENDVAIPITVLEELDHFKKGINIGYTFAPKLLQKAQMQNLRLYGVVDNVATLFSPFFRQTGIDPEGTGLGNQGVANPGNIRANNAGNGALTVGLGTPMRRTFAMGINLTL